MTKGGWTKAIDSLDVRPQENFERIARLQDEETAIASVAVTFSDLQASGFAHVKDAKPSDGEDEWQTLLFIVKHTAEAVLKGERGSLPTQYVQLLAAWADRVDAVGRIHDEGDSFCIEWTCDRLGIYEDTLSDVLKKIGMTWTTHVNQPAYGIHSSVFITVTAPSVWIHTEADSQCPRTTIARAMTRQVSTTRLRSAGVFSTALSTPAMYREAISSFSCGTGGQSVRAPEPLRR
jgi:hypothetical protein